MSPSTAVHRVVPVPLRGLLAACAAFVALAVAPAAHAVVYVDGSGEPAFTNTTTNTQWVSWQGSTAYATYKLEFDYYNGATFAGVTTMPVGANSTGSTWVNWGANTLVEGNTYGICAYGRYTIDGSIGSRDSGSCYHADQVGKRASTTIDRTKPSIGVKIDGGAAWSRTAKLTYHIDYSDNLAFPFPANFICRDVGSDPAQACANQTHEINDACSVPLGGMKKTTYFTCDEDLSVHNVGDGPVTLCVVSADAAIPDNPSSSNQARRADQANLSNRTCDSITLDRTAPTLAVGASATTVTVGDLVTFAPQASDATSGLAGTYAWSWGDNTPDGTGSSASHTFTAPGTYQVAVRTSDNAGNERVATQVITVNARPAGGAGTVDAGKGTGTATGAGTGTGARATVGGNATVTAAPTVQEVSKAAGGGGVQETALPGLEIAAPKRVKASSHARTLALALTAGTPGSAKIALTRGGRIHASGTVAVAESGTLGYRLKLPRRLPAGTYQLKVTWKPAGATAASTTTLKVTIVGKRSRAARAKAASRAPLVDAGGAPAAVPVGEMPTVSADRTVRLPLR